MPTRAAAFLVAPGWRVLYSPRYPLILLDITCSSKQPYRLEWVGPLVLCDAEVGRVPSGIPGVYLLHVFRPARALYDVFYAGNAGDLRARLGQHLRSASTSPDVRWLRAGMTLHFSAAPVLALDDRLAVEAGLIQMLRPPYNRQVPRRPAVHPNLPPFTLINFVRRP